MENLTLNVHRLVYGNQLHQFAVGSETSIQFVNTTNISVNIVNLSIYFLHCLYYICQVKKEGKDQ